MVYPAIEPSLAIKGTSDPFADTSHLNDPLSKTAGQVSTDDKAKHEAQRTLIADSCSEASADESVSRHHGGAFDQSVSEEHYAPSEKYEGRHRYDPKARWSREQEARLVRKLDLRICTWVCLMFFSLQLDRGNIVQAVSDNMLSDIGLSTDDYNTGMTIFYLCFLVAELPSQLVSKKLGPDNWIPIQMITWSVIAICQSRISGRTSFFVTRALLGVMEGGFIPDVVLYLSYFYTIRELPIRLSFFWTSYSMTFVIGAFLAYGILHLDGVHGMAGWQWLFVIEGAVTALIGIISYFYLPASPTQTASYFRGSKGWFSEQEEIVMVNRILRDDPSKGDMHNRQAVTPSLLWAALQDYDMWPVYLLGLTWSIPSTPATNYLTLTLRNLGFGTFTTSLLTVPAYVLFVLQVQWVTWLSERINNRFLLVLFCQFYMLPLIIALEVLPGGPSEQWSRYVLNIMLVGYPYIHAILVALTSRNAGSVRTRTVGSALYNMCVQAANIIASNIYWTNDQPLYRTGNKVLLGIIAWNIALICVTKVYYMWRNARREKVWDAMSEAQKVQYLTTTTDRGNKRLDFKFAH